MMNRPVVLWGRPVLLPIHPDERTRQWVLRLLEEAEASGVDHLPTAEFQSQAAIEKRAATMN